MAAVVLHRVGFLAHSCPKQGQDFKPSAAPLYPNMGQVPPRDLVLSIALIKVELPPLKIWKADVSSVNPSSKRFAN